MIAITARIWLILVRIVGEAEASELPAKSRPGGVYSEPRYVR